MPPLHPQPPSRGRFQVGEVKFFWYNEAMCWRSLCTRSLYVPWEKTGGLSHPLQEKLRLPAGAASTPKASVLCERSGGRVI